MFCMKDVWNFFMSIDSDRMRGWTWEFFIDVFFDLPNIIVHFLLLIFIYWDDAWHIYKHRNMVFDFIMEYLKTLVYLGVFIHNESNVAVPESTEHNDDSLTERVETFQNKVYLFHPFLRLFRRWRTKLRWKRREMKTTVSAIFGATYIN